MNHGYSIFERVTEELHLSTSDSDLVALSMIICILYL